MACPYFLPDEPASSGDSSARPRPPLGRFYGGRCLAGGVESSLPLERCNLGYARGMACFPGDCDADASRFSITEDDGNTVTVQWCVERDHRPLRWGVSEWRRRDGAFRETAGDSAFVRQLTAYTESYLAVREPSPNG